MNLTLHIWRQRNAGDKGGMVRYELGGINPDMSFLEMLDVLNEELIAKGEEPVAFDHDCREGICGTCGFMINGVAHGSSARDDGLPACTCGISTTATNSTWSLGARGPFLRS